MNAQKITVTLGNRGRKYFACTLHSKNGRTYQAKLILNAVCDALEPGQQVEISAIDRGEQTKYGKSLIFEPVTQEDGDFLRWLTYA